VGGGVICSTYVREVTEHPASHRANGQLNLLWVFGKFTMKKTIFRKLTILWEYFHGDRYYGKIPRIHGTMP
jgi:hypothetical protein